MRDALTTLIGKTVRFVARLRGGGSALPGLVVEKIDPGYMARVLDKLRYGVVVVSGTNGKTTTTKMIVELFEAHGLRVFTNSTGSNFSRGVVAAAVAESSITGKIDADIAVLELDEAHAMYFINRVAPRYTLLLNVLRDQLDRFGEIDTTAQYLDRIAQATTRGLVVNREDPLVARIGERVREADERGGGGRAVDSDEGADTARSVTSFGLAADLRSLFPSDADFVSPDSSLAPREDESTGAIVRADVVLESIDGHEATFLIDGESVQSTHKLEGAYNVFNAAAALTLARTVMHDENIEHSTPSLLEALSGVRPAFGRGERLVLDGEPLDLILVKNPAGFRLALTSFPSASETIMIAINDQYADGRDMSWLWDVDFRSLAQNGVHTVTGTRAWDMALRLEHDDVKSEIVEEDLGVALRLFREQTRGGPRRIFCTYTAMLALREQLATLTEVEDVW